MSKKAENVEEKKRSLGQKDDPNLESQQSPKKDVPMPKDKVDDPVKEESSSNDVPPVSGNVQATEDVKVETISQSISEKPSSLKKEVSASTLQTTDSKTETNSAISQKQTVTDKPSDVALTKDCISETMSSKQVEPVTKMASVEVVKTVVEKTVTEVKEGDKAGEKEAKKEERKEPKVNLEEKKETLLPKSNDQVKSTEVEKKETVKVERNTETNDNEAVKKVTMEEKKAEVESKKSVKEEKGEKKEKKPSRIDRLFSSFSSKSPPPPEEDFLPKEIIQVELQKRAVGLGFCIEGGKGSPLGDRPITVKRLYKGEFI